MLPSLLRRFKMPSPGAYFRTARMTSRQKRWRMPTKARDCRLEVDAVVPIEQKGQEAFVKLQTHDDAEFMRVTEFWESRLLFHYPEHFLAQGPGYPAC